MMTLPTILSGPDAFPRGRWRRPTGLAAGALAVALVACGPHNKNPGSNSASTAAAATTDTGSTSASTSAANAGVGSAEGQTTSTASTPTTTAGSTVPNTAQFDTTEVAKRGPDKPGDASADTLHNQEDTTTAGVPVAIAIANGKKLRSGPDKLVTNQSEYQGWKWFHVYCYRCHGTDAMGSDIAPNLRNSLGPQGGVSHTFFLYTAWNGRPTLGMPSWKQLLDSAQLNDVYTYVMARGMGNLVPGRPHLPGGK